MALRLFIVSVFMMAWINIADSFCMLERAPSHNPQHCVYKTRIFQLGSSYTDYDDCVEYVCYADGSMQVCGIGINAGVMMPPDGCKIIKGDKCEAKLVTVHDSSLDCQFINLV